jgi:hypothetical protein
MLKNTISAQGRIVQTHWVSTCVQTLNEESAASVTRQCYHDCKADGVEATSSVEWRFAVISI